jgi:hypothetical protein
MKFKIINQLFVALVFLSGINIAYAGIILQPIGASGSMNNLNVSYTKDALVNQVGLSAGYVSLVDDFDSIAASLTHNGSLTGAGWLSFANLDDPTNSLDFDLGGSFAVEQMALWNYGESNSIGIQRNIIQFRLLADDNAAFSSPDDLGTFIANPEGRPTSAVTAEVFSFTQIMASHIRMDQILAGPGAKFYVGAGEVAFDVATVPEPSTLAILVLGLIGLASRRFKTQS